MKMTKLSALAMTTALIAPAAFAEDMASEMTLVSWGGAYQSSQHRERRNVKRENNKVEKVI